MNGGTAPVSYKSMCTITVEEKVLELECLVSKLFPGCRMLLGMDAITILGGVRIKASSNVSFGAFAHMKKQIVSRKLRDEHVINDQDFCASFNGVHWIVKWRWCESENPPTFRNLVANYKIPITAEHDFDRVINEWITNGWLIPYTGEYEGILPLMAVVQINKNKVRPVMDFRELNNYVSSHTAKAAICGEKLRNWRKMSDNLIMLDLRNAYLQISIHESLYKYQVIKYWNKIYTFTRLGFGLNVAPKIMTGIVGYI